MSVKLILAVVINAEFCADWKVLHCARIDKTVGRVGSPSASVCDSFLRLASFKTRKDERNSGYLLELRVNNAHVVVFWILLRHHSFAFCSD